MNKWRISFEIECSVEDDKVPKGKDLDTMLENIKFVLNLASGGWCMNYKNKPINFLSCSEALVEPFDWKI